MSWIVLGEAFQLNPQIRIPKGDTAPFVAMDDVRSFERDVVSSRVKDFISGSKFHDGDVLMARITPSLENGKTSIYRAASDPTLPAFGSTEFIIIRGRPGISDSTFGYYLVTSPSVRDYAISLMNGSSGRQRVQVDAFGLLEIDLPSLSDQRSIAAALGSLDDKIESNRRVVKFGEELIHAKVLEVLKDVSEVISVIDLARFVNGGAYTKGASGAGRMVVRIKELNSGPGSSTVYNDIEVPEDKIVRAGDLLMSWSGSLGVYRWFRDEAIVNQHIFKVLPQQYPDWLVFDRLQSVITEFQTIAEDKATTMGHIKRGHLETTQVKMPSDEFTETLDRVLSPLWERITTAEQENRKLTALRDALLPELLSGRIRAPEASEAVDEALV